MAPAGLDPAPGAESLWEVFTRTARRVPKSPALSDGRTTYTYAELHRVCLNAAAALWAAGVARGDAVLISTDHSADGVLALLAVCAAGGTPVPVEPDGPRGRFERIATGSGARIGLVDDTGHRGVAENGLATLRISDAVRHPTPVSGPLASSNLAYVLFTSGSTGVPKGVEVTQTNVLSLLRGASQWDNSTSDDVWGCFHSFTFDVSMWEIWRPLSLGGRVHVLPRTAQIDGGLAHTLIDEHGISALSLTPTAARLLALHVSERGLPRRLRLLTLIGERLDFAMLKPLLPALSEGVLEIWNLYGPTETTIYATAYRMGPADIDHESRSLIGRPLPGMVAEIHSPDPGGVGELWLSGDLVAEGYRGDEQLTRERFVIDEQGRRAYRTGDLVRDSGGGVLEFIGRTGGFMKVRGYRIEPGEITTALCTHPAVTEAAIVVSCVLTWGETVVAAVVLRSGATVTEIDLRRHVADILPDYTRPGRIVFLDVLPRLASAKLDTEAVRKTVAGMLGS
ncbi:AMP-binding protein [Streptomyces sp. NPDC059970]|uniref:AMP-binding protein n=1 Tax=Streptomyces sp. NPDC059970 TaxID=3347019 RepID=UPI003692E31A